MFSKCNHPIAPAKMTFKILDSKVIYKTRMSKNRIRFDRGTRNKDPTFDRFGFQTLNRNEFGIQNLEGHFCRCTRVIAFQNHRKIPIY